LVNIFFGLNVQTAIKKLFLTYKWLLSFLALKPLWLINKIKIKLATFPIKKIGHLKNIFQKEKGSTVFFCIYQN